MKEPRTKRAIQRAQTVRDDWFAWIPNEMDELFGSTRNDLESSNFMLSVTLDEAFSLCAEGQFESSREMAGIFSALFDRLTLRVVHVIRTIKDHGSHFGTLPNVSPLEPSNFRGTAAQNVAVTNNLLAKVVFRGRTRFFHKLSSLGEIIEDLQNEAHWIVADLCESAPPSPDLAWRQLEVLVYDLNTCMVETTVILKSFFCALPPEELEAFRKKLADPVPSHLVANPGQMRSFDSK